MPSLSRRRLLSTVTSATAGLLASCGARPRSSRPPNFVLILADDLGSGELGCYGQQRIRTPHLGRVAAEGMLLTDAYAGCTVSAPSRSVLMTGLHGGHTPIRANTGGIGLIDPDFTVAEALQKRDYVSGCFGEWGLGDIGTEGVPWRQGFNEFFGYLHQVHAHQHYPAFLYENESKFPLPGNENGGRETYAHDVIAGRALDFIERHRDQPFFCYVPFSLPHLELLAPEDSMAEYRGQFPEPVPYTDPSGHYAPQPEPRTAHAAMITRMDRNVGRLLALLDELSLAENTLVLFSSDNGGARPAGGEFFGTNGVWRGYKGDLYEGGIRVPLLARWPGQVPAGFTSHHPCAFCDVFPTFLDLAGVDIPPSIDGLSMTQTLLHQGEQRAHEFLYWEYPRYDAKTGEFPSETPPQAVRWNGWKAVRPEPNGALELYSLISDGGETTDVAAARPDVIARIEEYLASARSAPRPQIEPPSDWTSAATAVPARAPESVGSSTGTTSQTTAPD